MVVWPMVAGCAMYLFGPTNGGSINGCWLCNVPVWPNQWWFDQWLLGVLCTCLAQPMMVRPMVIGCAMSYLAQPLVVGCGMYRLGPTNGGFDQWLLGVLCTYLAQPMVVLTNGYWVFYVPIWHNQWLLSVLCTCLAQPMVVRPMVVGCGMYHFSPTNGGTNNGCWVCYVPVWPNQWWFDQWLLCVLCWVWYVPF